MTFHDGTPLTAADVVASMSRHLDPAVGSSWYSVYQNVASIEQTGDREVTVDAERSPDSQFNLAMGGSAGVIESAATLAEAGADYGNSTGGVNCTGPVQPRGVEVGRVDHARALRRLLGRLAEGASGRGRVPLHDRPDRAR